jgi:sterol desaturase/sphingolipid hydroxylase (fatty acid hydroxylase superfamily)
MMDDSRLVRTGDPACVVFHDLHSSGGIELLAPRLERDEMRGALKSRRWMTNLAMVVLSSVALRILFPAAAVGTAIWAKSNGIRPAADDRNAACGLPA